ncbi:hypothetical protein JW960_01310 [candidate division KSB1 bacterium]|nr:hypothetical protein [candidate division KSB1 bacterium]
MNQMKRVLILPGIAIFAILITTSCSKNTVKKKSPTEPSTETNVIVTVIPDEVRLAPGESHKFDAMVSGAADTSVTWSINPNQGSIDNQGRYTAPASITPSSLTVKVKATSNADNNASAEAFAIIEKPVVDQAATAKAGYGASDFVRTSATDGASLCAEAVWEASLQNGGQLVTTGTLTQSGQNFIYNSTPNNKLLVKFSNGTQIEFMISAFNGDFSSTASNFLENDHQFFFSAKAEGSMNLQVQSLQNGGTKQAVVSGTIIYENTSYTVNMTEQGSYTSSVDVGSAEYEVQEQTTGTITASGFNLTINEQYRYKSIYVDNFVENIDRVVNNSWTQDGVNYALNNVRVRKAFFNTKPSELDSYWIVQGTLIENGSVIGQMGAETTALKLQIFMQLPDEKVILEEYLLN